MLMRPAPPQATGPSPCSFTTSTQRLHPGVEHPSRTEPIRSSGIPASAPAPAPALSTLPSPVTVAEYSAARPPLHPDATAPGQRHRREELQPRFRKDLVPSPRGQVGAVGAETRRGNGRPDGRSIPRSRRRGEGDRGGRGGRGADGNIRRRKLEGRGTLLPGNAEDRDAGDGRGGSGLPPESPDRVPFHAAFADDPAFHRPDQEVVADDNTENHRRTVPPLSDNFSDYDRPENRHDVKILPPVDEAAAAIAAASATTDTADTTARRVPGGRYRQRQRHKAHLDGASIPDDNDVEETDEEQEEEEEEEEDEDEEEEEEEEEETEEEEEEEEVAEGEEAEEEEEEEEEEEVVVEEEEEEVLESRWTDLDEYRDVDVAPEEVPRFARSEHLHKQQFRKRAPRRIDDRTCGLVLLLYLLALPILCASKGSPPGARGTLGFTQNGPATHPRNSTHRVNLSARILGMSPESEEERHPYRDYSWEVNQINPWLSACDLAGPAPADLQGSCGPPETPKNCPDACRKSDARASRAVDSFFAVVSQASEYRGKTWDGGGGVPRPEAGGRAAPEQCLFYLEESHKTEICRDDFGKDSSKRFLTVRENRYRFLSGLRLRHCCEHAALNALASGDGGPLEEVLGGSDGCRIAIEKLLAVDALAARLHCEFGEVLARYDCGQPYSVIYNCSHCKEAYRRWVCSSLVPYFAHDDQPNRQKNEGLAGPLKGIGMRIRPCRSFCQSVEQRCPYLLPGDRAPAYPTQYAGEPTFLCRDPNIPETGEQASRALHADEECCFHVCSDEDPGRGVCANCTEPQVEIAIRGGNAQRDPSTAPQCELNPASSPGHHQSTTSGAWPDSISTTETPAGSPVNPGAEVGGGVERAQVSGGANHQSSSSSSGSGASFCGSGGVGSMSSSSAAPRVAPLPIKMCAFCAWGALVGLCTIKVATSWTTSESSLCPSGRRLACPTLLNAGDCKNVKNHRRRCRRRRSSPGKSVYLVISSCSLIRSFLSLVVYDVLLGLSTACYELLKVKLKWRYKRDILYLDDIGDRRSPINPTRPRRRRRRGCKRRRRKKKRRRRAS